MSEGLSKKYREAVEEAKKLVKFRTELKYEIVKIALSVCVIKEGNSNSYEQYTLSAFARDIGVAKGTISRWKLEYENVISKVGVSDSKKINRYALDETMRKVKKDTPPETVKKIYSSFEKGFDNSEDKTMVDYVRRLRSMRFFICYSANINKLKPEMVKEMKSHLEDMLKTINTGNKKNVKTVKVKKAIEKAMAMKY